MWELQAGQEPAQLSHIFNIRGRTVRFSEDASSLVIIDTEGITHVVELRRRADLLTLPSHPGGWLLAAQPGGQSLVTAGEDGKARVWDISLSREVQTLYRTGPGAVFGPDGTSLATGAIGGAILWDLASGEPMFETTGPELGVRGVALSPDGAFVASAGNDGIARIWDASTGERELELAGHGAAIWDVDYGPDGTRLATASEDGTAKIWDAGRGEELLTLTGHTDIVFSIDHHPEQDWVATGSWDNTARVWDVSGSHDGATTGSAEELFQIQRNADVLDVDFSPDGRRLALSDAGGLATVWDISAGEPQLRLTLKGHTRQVARIAFDPEGTRIASVGSDGTVRVWDADTGGVLLHLTLHNAMLSGVGFSPNGRYLASTGGERALIYALELDDLVDLAHERLTRSLTTDECQRHLHLEACP